LSLYHNVSQELRQKESVRGQAPAAKESDPWVSSQDRVSIINSRASHDLAGREKVFPLPHHGVYFILCYENVLSHPVPNL
jgi:hypothetical protein